MTKSSFSKERILEEYLVKNIPISSAIGVRVDMASPTKIVLSAPFSNNINHQKTVFGGSLHAVATLACWSLLHVNLNLDVQIVIASSEIAYLAPVTSDFKAECSMPHPGDWERFMKILQKRGKARLMLCATIFQDGQLCVDYEGMFVACRNVVKESQEAR